VVILDWLQGSALSVGLRSSNCAYPLANPLHVPALAVVAGLLLFIARPLDYVFDPLFLFILGFIALALLNIVLVHRSESWGTAVNHN
jgi:hypothetical protein